jgi:hypothetical protein
MMHHRLIASMLSAALSLTYVSLSQAQDVPPPDQVIRRACDAAGGLEAFQRLGILHVNISGQEISQEGTPSTQLKDIYFLTPGPVPGRFELPTSHVVAGDDGSAGWAVVDRKLDARRGTSYMVRRSLAKFLFSTMLPFSLSWEGVTITKVTPAEVKKVPVWRVTIEVPRSFFDSPQVATTWTVDFDRHSFALVGAESPFVDLGKGITADGMRFFWSQAVTVKGVRFFSEQRVIGLDEVGAEKSHTRTERISYQILPEFEAAKLFANPVPPEQRPAAKMP